VSKPLRHLAVARAGAVATVTLDRPPVNAVDLEVIDEFLRAVADVAADPAVRAMIDIGRERRFCAGADIAMLQDLSPQNQARAPLGGRADRPRGHAEGMAAFLAKRPPRFTGA
jgi:enoyl-CoA hydratase/carnithine racemase